MKKLLILISSILLLFGCIPSRQERDRMKYDQLLQKYPDWKNTDTIWSEREAIIPAKSDSGNIPENKIDINKIVDIIESNESKEVIKEEIIKYITKYKFPPDTIFKVGDYVVTFSKGKIKIDEPEQKIKINVPIQTNTYQPSPAKTWKDLVKDNFVTIIKAMAFWGFLILILIAALIIKRVYRSN